MKGFQRITQVAAACLAAWLPASALAQNSAVCPVPMQFAGTQQAGDENNPAIWGGVLVYYWSQIEPTKFANLNDAKAAFEKIVDPDISLWAAKGKKVILRFSTAGQTSWAPPYSQQGTPTWLLNEEQTSGYVTTARYIKEVNPNPVDPNSPGDGAILPVYWNPTYLAELQTFIGYISAYYGSSTSVALVEMGVGDGGELLVDTEHTGSNQAADNLALWAPSPGADPAYSDNLCFATQQTIMNDYKSAFGASHPLAVLTDNSFYGRTCVQDPPPSWSGYTCPQNPTTLRESTVLDWAVDQNFWLQDDGFTATTTAYPAPWTSAAGILSEERDETGAGLPAVLTNAENLAKTAHNMKYLLIFRDDIYYNNGANQSALMAYKTACSQ